MSLLHKLEWRYATKKFDSEKEISEENITELLKAANLSASSYGLQPYEFIVVKNQELQNKLQEAAYGQAQLADASHVVIFAAKKTVSPDYIKNFVQHTAEIRNQDLGELNDYQQSMIDTIGSMSSDQQLSWTQRQSYIALGTLLLAAADLKIDACPMEGFENEKFNKLLELDAGLHATAIVTLGYRSVNDTYQHAAKVRRPLDDIVTLRYSE